MKFVEPIRDEQKIKSMKKLLKAQSDRDHLLFSVGINAPYRIGDLMRFRFRHLVDEKGKVLSHFRITEEKTGKVNHIAIGKSLQKDIRQYMDRYFQRDYTSYVFASRKGTNQPISREHAWYIIHQAAKEVGLENIGAHSMRKTFGYHLRKKGTDIELIMELLNHSSTRETLRYIGITQDEKDHAVLSLDL